MEATEEREDRYVILRPNSRQLFQKESDDGESEVVLFSIAFKSNMYGSNKWVYTHLATVGQTMTVYPKK